MLSYAMADFCYDCKINYSMGAPAQNDMRHDEPEPVYDLCEGCGYGWFDREGKRLPDDFQLEGLAKKPSLLDRLRSLFAGQ